MLHTFHSHCCPFTFTYIHTHTHTDSYIHSCALTDTLTHSHIHSFTLTPSLFIHLLTHSQSHQHLFSPSSCPVFRALRERQKSMHRVLSSGVHSPFLDLYGMHRDTWGLQQERWMEGPSGHSFLNVSHSGPLKAGKSMGKAKWKGAYIYMIGFDFLGLILILSHRLI